MAWMRELAIIPALGVGITAGLLVVLDDRRAGLALLAGQYLCVTWLVSLELPFPIAAAKLVAGLMACASLALSVAALRWQVPVVAQSAIPSGHAFRWIAVLLVATVGAGLARTDWMSLPGMLPQAVLGSTLLLAYGLLQTGITEDPLRVGTGLLTLLSGFEVAYSVIEPSLAVIALVAAVHLGIALVVSYIMLTFRELPVPSEDVS